MGNTRYGSWKQCFRERLQLASNSTCSYIEIYTFYLGIYQGKQTLVSGRKTTFVPKLLYVQAGNLCLGTGCVGGDSSYFTCLTFTNCYKSVRDLMWVLVSEEGTTAEFREFLPWALSCRLVPWQQDFSKAYLSSAALSFNSFKSTLNLLWGFTIIEM